MSPLPNLIITLVALHQRGSCIDKLSSQGELGDLQWTGLWELQRCCHLFHDIVLFNWYIVSAGVAHEYKQLTASPQPNLFLHALNLQWHLKRSLQHGA